MAGRVVFFDLGDTLGVGRVGPGGSIAGFDPFPFATEILKKLKDPVPAGLGVRLGVISNTPTGTTAANMAAVLGAAGVLSFFDPALLLYSSVEGLDKTQKAFFTLAASRAATPPRRCVFVGEDPSERNVASSAHFATALHPLHVFQVLKTLP
jgi:FMN phosphatase YigB (HAD superfamily)